MKDIEYYRFGEYFTTIPNGTIIDCDLEDLVFFNPYYNAIRIANLNKIILKNPEHFRNIVEHRKKVIKKLLE